MRVLRCRTCNAEIEGDRIHSGFNETVFLYCDTDSTVLTFSVYDSKDREITGKNIPWYVPEKWDLDSMRLIEAHLIPCPCGGRFSFKNPLRCPNCGGMFSEPMSKTHYFMDLGRRIDGEKLNVWRD